MKAFFMGMILVFFIMCGCGSGDISSNTAPAPVGRIGDDMPVTRGETAKMIALAFYSPDEIGDMDKIAEFPDVGKEEWYYPYINAVVKLGFFSGDDEGFRPTDGLKLWEAQLLMDRLAPDYESQMVITEDNRDMEVAYSLWTELYDKALRSRRGEDSLYSYGIEKKTQVLFYSGEENIFDRDSFTAAGCDMNRYTDEKITFWAKEGEIVSLLEVTEDEPTVKNIYCYQRDDKAVLIGAGEKEYFFGDGEFEAGLYNVTISDGKATLNESSKLQGETVKRVDGKEIHLSETGVMKWAEGFRVYDAELRETRENALICGADTADIYISEGQVMGAVIQKDPLPENIRVLLGGGLQEEIRIEGEEGFSLSNGVGEKSFSAGAAVLTADLAWFDHGFVRIGGNVTLEFKDGTRRSYRGKIELERIGDSIAVINEVPMEEYLLGVVPNEMPVSFGQGALEAQAICARSYAYNQFFANTYGHYGAHVTDTVASQVYMGADTALEAQNAVEATEGMCAVAEEGVAQTYFYSTSCGFGAAAKDVWSRDGSFGGRDKSYLVSQGYGIEREQPQTEEEWMAFWQDWDIEGYDSDSPWFRWKVYFGAGQLKEILEETLPAIWEENKNTVLVKTGEGEFKTEKPAFLGKLKGVEVSQRGDGGVIQILTLYFENKMVQVKTEYAVRQALSPTKRTVGEDIYLQRISGGTLTGQKILPSGFFAVREMRNDEGTLTGIALYGGGNGHGVGMSQYGARELSQRGMTGAEIIKEYYPNTEVVKVM